MKQVVIEKQAQVSEIKEKIAASSSIVVTDYRGLRVDEVTELRNKLRAEGVEFQVLKNNIVRRACVEAGVDPMEDILKGPTAVAFSADAVAAAKIIFEFLKKHKNLQVKGGLLDGKEMDAAQMEVLGNIPSREALLSQLVGTFVAAMRGFIGAVDVLRENKESAEA